MAWLSVEHFLLLTRAEKAVRRNGRMCMYFDRFWHYPDLPPHPALRLLSGVKLTWDRRT
jgi:hypothetical protein